MESPIKIDAECEAGSCGRGLRRGEPPERGVDGTDDAVVTSLSRRALSYSIDNLLASTSTSSAPRHTDDNQSAAAASLRLHSISQQRTHFNALLCHPPDRVGIMQ